MLVILNLKLLFLNKIIDVMNIIIMYLTNPIVNSAVSDVIHAIKKRIIVYLAVIN